MKLLQAKTEYAMAHAFTAVMNGRELSRFMDIPKELVEQRVIVTIDPLEKQLPGVEAKLQKLFAEAPTIKVTATVMIDSLLDEMNDALS